MKKPANKQSGSILLALMLIMVVAASFALVSRLNASSRTFIRQQSTMETLQRAKAALIAYAVTYPEQSGTSDPAAGPGYMPCPDADFPPDGSPNPFINSCNETIDRYTGRLPGEFLSISNYVDSSGERIWYAISDNFRNIGNKFSPINDDTTGGLSIDTNNDGVGDITDIVAILIAPGPPVDSVVQNRPSNQITDYLEGENADGDAVFAQNSGGGNDVLVYITKQELMRAVEKRVSGDVVNALKSYQADTGVFPWLTAFNPDPAVTDYDATGVGEGGLAYNDINEVFQTDFSVGWDIRSGGNGTAFALTPTATMPDWNSFGPRATPPASAIKVDMPSVYYNLDGNSGPACRWISRDAIECVGRAQDPDPVTLQVTVLGVPVISASGTRYYDFDIVIPSDGTASICSYTACTNKVRNR